MDEIIKILRLNRTASEVSVTVSTLDSPVVLPEDAAHKHRLKEGIVITTPQLEKLKSEAELFRCDRETVRLLALREHSIGELKAKLAKKHFTPDAIRQVIKKFKERGILDDARYAHTLAENLLHRRPSGRSYLTAYLQRKMISRSLADQTVEEVLSGKDESELAVSALENRWAEFSQFELEVARRKSYNYLARRGFGYEAARAAFEQLQKLQDEVTKD